MRRKRRNECKALIRSGVPLNLLPESAHSLNSFKSHRCGDSLTKDRGGAENTGGRLILTRFVLLRRRTARAAQLRDFNCHAPGATRYVVSRPSCRVLPPLELIVVLI